MRIAGEAAPGVRSVLQLKLFHPANDHYGLSPIEAAAAAIDLHNAAARWNKALLDNSARPSGALVYSNGANMTGDQFERLKQELEASFQGTRSAGRPLLLEGGLDWKAMGLVAEATKPIMSPRDLDFMEAKNSAAREIALAIGVPPMLLGIPGDNTYSNMAEANRAFWRQTVLPLVARTARALGGWLGPAYGGDLRLAADLDAVEALSPEREALWARLESASFLTDDEKRSAVGYGTKAEGGDSATGPFARKYRDDQARDDQGRWVDEGGGGAARIRLAQIDGSRQYSVDLREEELRGGHTLRSHVGKTDDDLISVLRAMRLQTPFVTISKKAQGSFTSIEAANDFTNGLLQSNSGTVDLVASGQLKEAWLEDRIGSRTGREAFRPDADSQPYARDTYKIGAFIRHDPKSPRGYRVITAYPLNDYPKN